MKVLAKYLDGRKITGRAMNVGSKDVFHLTTEAGWTTEVPIASLKAVFFPRKGGESALEPQPRYGKKLLVNFRDGEEILGVSVDYREDKESFFLFPLDVQDNNERILINNLAVRKVDFIGATYGLSETTQSPGGVSRTRKGLEHEVYKLLYSVATDLNHPTRIEDEVFLKDRLVFLKNRVKPVLEDFNRFYGETDCKKCLDEKLLEIQSMMGDRVYRTLVDIIGKMG